MKRIVMRQSLFNDNTIQWLIENISPLASADYRLCGETWVIYIIFAPSGSYGYTFDNTVEIAFNNDDDAMLFSLSFPCEVT